MVSFKDAALLCCTALRCERLQIGAGLLGDGSSCEKKKNDAEDDDTGDKEGLSHLNATQARSPKRD